MQQFAHTDLIAHAKEHRGSLVIPFFPGFFIDAKFVVQFELALLDQVKGDIDCHHLGHGGGRNLLVRIFLEQHGSGGKVRHIGYRRIGFKAGCSEHHGR